MQLNLLLKVLLSLQPKLPDLGKKGQLLVVLLFVALLQLLSKSGQAQNITINVKAVSLESVIKQVGKQSGYQVFYRKDQLDISKFPVTISLKNAELTKALDAILADKPFTYTITNKTIVLTLKRPQVPTSSEYPAKGTINVTGKIVDSDGRPFSGITIFVNDLNLYSSTGDDGSFSISSISPNSILKCFGVNMISFDEEVKGRTNITIVAQNKINALQEVVINKGYYTEEQKLSTGDVFTVKGTDILKTPTTNPILALEGRVPGLFIQQNSGLPGAAPTVLIRGQNSITNGLKPLYIVDGIPYNQTSLSLLGGYQGQGSSLPGLGIDPLAAINPNDIEEITVLKDADATAIYGSRGANGVILITTKKGKAGNFTTSFNISSALSQYTHFVKLLNTQQFIAARKEALRNDGLAPNSYDYDINGKWDQSRYTDWQKTLLGNAAHINNYQGSISGGDANTQYSVNGGYRTQSLIYTHGKDLGDKLGSIRANINHTSLNKKLNIAFDLGYVSDNNVVPVRDPTGAALSLQPNAPALYNADGTLNFEKSTFQNPLTGMLQTARSATDNILGNLAVKYKITGDLNFNANIGYNKQQLDEVTLIPAASIDPAALAGYPAAVKADQSHGISKSWIVEPQLNYTHAIGRGQFSALIGGTLQQTQNNSYGFRTTGAPNDNVLQDYSSATSITAISPTIDNFKYEAVYARLNYNWESKYVVNITARRDGSSRFGPDNRFGNFGAAGAAWIFSEESWGKNLGWLSLGKLRGSYGITGNDQISSYSYFSYYNYYSYPYQGISTLVPRGLENPDVHWEVNKKLEFGIDLSFINNRINVTANYFRNRSGNQLVSTPLPDIAGLSSILTNLPAVVQNTGFEGVINTVNIKTSGFTWRTSFNISATQNKLVSFPGIEQTAYASFLTVGQSLSAQRKYHFTGVDPATGVYTFQDINKDGKLDGADYVVTKSMAPKYYGGFNNNFNYKGFQLDVFFQFVNKLQSSYLVGGSPGGSGNKPVEVLQRWQKPGDNAAIQRFTTAPYGNDAGNAFSNYQFSDATIVNGSFVRLKNVNLSYTLPKTFVKHIGVTNAQLYFTADNLFTITPYVGADPETGGSALPPIRTLLVGLSLSL